MFRSFPFHQLLLPWYRNNARDLPWRRTQDPYSIWVSEIMLQQTQVQTVIPYYEKWLCRFPDIGSLAEAAEPEVMKYWAGLGYYRRARMLHKAAKFIVEKHGGKFPDDPEKILELPGVGRYTAGAIASIAFGKKQPILDGNVIRILCRIFGVAEDTGSPKTLKKLWEISESVLPGKNPGDFNQAMMELGATVCSPQNPSCLICPVSENCHAYKMKSWAGLPYKKNREKLEKIGRAALILRKNGKVLVEKQPSEARWGGLWMFPHADDRNSVLKKFGLKEANAKHRLTVFHGFTKYKVQLDVYESAASGKAPMPEGEYKWAAVKELDQIAFPAPHKKISLAVIKNHGL